ncbi:RHS repeat domain-containing protein [Halobacteroides halobius]|nr:RHS repeat-associated core domain-containing protein [Halobacteroides halobius]
MKVKRKGNNGNNRINAGKMNKISEYYYAEGKLIAMNYFKKPKVSGGWWPKHPNKGLNFYHKDALGSVTMTSGRNGQAVERYEYDAYGDPYNGWFEHSAHNQNVFGFTGQRYSNQLGTWNFAYRHYNSQSMRWITVDPVKDGTNWYVYVNANSINYIDPLDLQMEENIVLDLRFVKITDDQNSKNNKLKKSVEKSIDNIPKSIKKAKKSFNNSLQNMKKYTKINNNDVLIDTGFGSKHNNITEEVFDFQVTQDGVKDNVPDLGANLDTSIAKVKYESDNFSLGLKGATVEAETSAVMGTRDSGSVRVVAFFAEIEGSIKLSFIVPLPVLYPILRLGAIFEFSKENFRRTCWFFISLGLFGLGIGIYISFTSIVAPYYLKEKYGK